MTDLDTSAVDPWNVPITRVGLGHQVATRLRDAILRGRYSPGDPLLEAQLAKSFAVSRGPVRDALAELESEGLVTTRPHQTAIVAVLTREDVAEVYSLRLALETLAAHWAVRHATDEDLGRLDAALRNIEELTNATFTGFEITQADLEFHDGIYAASHHERLVRAWSNVRSQVYLFLLKRNLTNRDLPSRDWTSRLVSDHRAILGALRDRDEDRFVTLMEAHLREPYMGLIRDDQRDERQGPSVGK